MASRRDGEVMLTRTELKRLVFGAAIAVTDYPTATWRQSVQRVVDKYAWVVVPPEVKPQPRKGR